MSIYYTPVLINNAIPIFTDLTIDKTNLKDSGIIQSAIEKAIQNTIVIPFQNWCVNLWSGFIALSHYVCLFVAIGGVIYYICGIEKGKKVAIVSVLVYVGFQLINWIILG